MFRRRPKPPRYKVLSKLYRRLPIAKGGPRKDEKDLVRAHRVAVIQQTRRAVWARSKGGCELCRDSEIDTWKKIEQRRLRRPHEHHLHEAFIKRSAGQNLPPEAVFNTSNCCRLCPFCHEAAELNKIVIVASDSQFGCVSGIVAVPKVAKRSRRVGPQMVR